MSTESTKKNNQQKKENPMVNLPQMGTMLLVHATIDGGKRTFGLIPITKDCPYLEAIYHPEKKVMALVMKDKKPHFNFVPKVDGLGMPVLNNSARTKDQFPYQQERKMYDVFHELHLDTKEDIINITEILAVNADRFPVKEYL